MTGYVYDGVPVDRSWSTGRDAEGNRVAKGTITSWSCDPSANGLTAAANETDYVLGPGGEQVTELAQDANGSMNWQRSYVYAGGALIATYDPVPNPAFNPAQYNPANPTVDPPNLPLPSFRLTDWLGTMRATTDAAGVWQGGCTGLPFGGGQACNGNIPDPHHFTGKERDAESGNDYFEARYYASSMGRFLSPDWSAQEEPVPYANLDDPQSLNLYSYVRNNPLTNVDPDGHCGGPGEGSCGDRYSVSDVENIVDNEVGDLRDTPQESAPISQLYTDLTDAIKNGEQLPVQPTNAGPGAPANPDPTIQNNINQSVSQACQSQADSVSGADKFNNRPGNAGGDTRTFKGPFGKSTAPIVKKDGPYAQNLKHGKVRLWWETFSRQKDERLVPKPKPKPRPHPTPKPKPKHKPNGQ
jgi:RHS repeat-associated protein